MNLSTPCLRARHTAWRSRFATALRHIGVCALLGLQGWPTAQAQDNTSNSAALMWQLGPSLSMELKNARWFDGKGFQKGTLWVVDGEFVAKKPAKLHRYMDLNGQYLVPPLADAHNHNLANGWAYERFSQRYLQDGVFYAAMLCTQPSAVAEVEAKAEELDGPDLVMAASCITSSDGHPLAAMMGPPDEQGQTPVKREDLQDKALILADSVESVRAQWPKILQRQKAAESEWITVVMSHHDHPELRARPEMQGRLGLQPDVVKAIVRLAHAAQLKVNAQVDTVADFAAAVSAGVNQISHLPGYINQHGFAPQDYLLSPELAQQAARAKVRVVTATASTTLFPTDPTQLEQLRTVQRHNLKLLHAAGVTLLSGSDLFTGTVMQEWLNLNQLQALPSAELLKMASITTPQALFPDRRIGCFAPGCEASFLVLVNNPLEQAEALSTPMLRVMQGALLTQIEQIAQSAGTEQVLPSRKPVARKPALKKAKGKKIIKGKSKASGKQGKASTRASAKGSSKKSGAKNRSSR
ncbi:amidohydrolase family protein [Roseateles sp. BYS180W]|uniref:Amidohydrolase family protein n=1 Tax=Roseateles rivi TaxID=3299028 RepID=A0ABW7FSY1_9BURK